MEDNIEKAKNDLRDNITFFLEDYPDDNKVTAQKYKDAKGFSPMFSNKGEIDLLKNIRSNFNRLKEILSSGKSTGFGQWIELSKIVSDTCRNYSGLYKFVDKVRKELGSSFDSAQVHDQSLIDEKSNLKEALLLNLKSLESIRHVLEIPHMEIQIGGIKEEIEAIKDTLKDNALSKFEGCYSRTARRFSLISLLWLFFGVVFIAISFWIITSFYLDINITTVTNGGLNGTTAVLNTLDIFNAKDMYSNLKSAGLELDGFKALYFSFMSLLLLLSMPFYLIVASFRNYKVNKHNQLYNQHKSLSISTFSTLLSSVEGDAELKRIIVDKVTSTIFDTPDFGYLKKESDNQQLPYPFPHQVLKRINGAMSGEG